MIRRDILKALALAVPLSLPLGPALATEAVAPVSPVAGRWPIDKVKAWYAQLPWLVGANYLPSNKINTIDMWQASTWDPRTIGRELKLAQSIGYNTMRVFLHPLVWEDDEQGLYRRMDRFLAMAKQCGIRPSFVLFDDCHYPYAKLGPQPLPVPAFHNSAWVNAPARELAERYARGEASAQEVAALKRYVQRTIGRFANDRRVLYWELYNEPGRGNGEYDASGKLILAQIGDRSKQLVHDSWVWARAVNPSQPITSTSLGGIGETNSAINAANSDIYSIHVYDAFTEVQKAVESWSAEGRPVLVTEWLNRSTLADIPKDMLSLFSDAEWHRRFDGTNIPKYVLPYLKTQNVGAINWGFVTGKSETNWHWSSRYVNGKIRNLAAERKAGNVILPGDPLPEPKLWFHDLFGTNHAPHDQAEIEVFKSLTAAPRSWPAGTF
ncbi:hypothetical protein [Sphingomonas sp. SUN039]|uniref:hypothetical protein n=1 Tax=Sphingomonas sp. SUN039 TaxID=2937787 RepID=UPI0021644F25|nr:hypothetical protein [Sphingomonas sp. SUN039]UVO53771.1 hypothetical protein M0209_06400 [Sphingomonas sp. SUN039]